MGKFPFCFVDLDFAVIIIGCNNNNNDNHHYYYYYYYLFVCFVCYPSVGVSPFFNYRLISSWSDKAIRSKNILLYQQNIQLVNRLIFWNLSWQ